MSKQIVHIFAGLYSEATEVALEHDIVEWKMIRYSYQMLGFKGQKYLMHPSFKMTDSIRTLIQQNNWSLYV